MKYQFILLLVVAVVFLSSPAFSDAILSVQPSVTTANPGDVFSINIDVSGVTDLYAFQFDLTFDPSILSGLDTSEGSFLPQGGSTIFIPGAIDNVVGTVTFTADTLAGLGPGASGDGTLASLLFQSLSSGSSPIDLSNVILLDSSGGDISASLINGSVTVPEPGILLLLATSLGALWVGRHKLSR